MTPLEAHFDEWFSIFRVVAREQAARRGAILDDYMADEAAASIAFWLVEHPTATTRDGRELTDLAPWAIARHVWHHHVWYRVIGGRQPEALPEDVAAQQDDSLTHWAIKRRLERMDGTDQLLAVRLLEGEATRLSGSQRRRLARIRAALQEAVA